MAVLLLLWSVLFFCTIWPSRHSIKAKINKYLVLLHLLGQSYKFYLTSWLLYPILELLPRQTLKAKETNKIRKSKGKLNLNIRYCNVCKLNMFPRARHCTVCGVCVKGYDHHCPWTSKCIGQHNLFRFYFFAAFTPLFLIFCVIMLSIASAWFWNSSYLY